MASESLMNMVGRYHQVIDYLKKENEVLKEENRILKEQLMKNMEKEGKTK